jgi:hypothetical protein
MGQAIRPIFVKLSSRESSSSMASLLPKTVRVGNKAAFRSPDKEFAVPLTCMYSCGLHEVESSKRMRELKTRSPMKWQEKLRSLRVG